MSTPSEMTVVEPDAPRYAAGRLALGLFGRMWLSFLGGVLLVTLLPLLLGWRPYVIESASMAPAIRAGDVVVSSPNDDPDVLVGRVIVFDPPDRPDITVTHRVVGADADGNLVTKGDANQSADSAPLPPDRVRGLGRLLVRGAGLPVLWLHDGAWLHLVLLAASIAIAVAGVVRDDEEELLVETTAGEVSETPPRRWIPIAAIPRGSRDEVHDPVPSDDDVSKPATLPRSRRRALVPSRERRDGDRHDTVHDRDAVHDQERDAERGERDDRSDRHDGDPPSPSPATPERRSIRRSPDHAPAPADRPSRRGLAAVAIAGLAALGIPTTAAAGFTSSSGNLVNAWSVPNVDYATEVDLRGPYLYWRLDETNGNRAGDSSGNGNDGRYLPNGNAASFTRLADGALLTDAPDRAVQLNSTNSCIATRSNTAIAGPQVYTVVAWFRAPSTYTDGGKLIGFERPQTGVDAPSAGNYDRQLHLDGAGRLWFTVYNGGHVALSSAGSLNDGAWHMAVGTQGLGGMALFVDGVQIASNTNTVAENTTGWWRAGCGNLSGWGGQWTGPNNPGTNSAVPQNRPFLGALDEIAVYSGVALTATDVANLWFAR